MSYLLPALALAVVAALAVAARFNQMKKLRGLEARLRAQWGRPKARERDLPLVAGYHHALARGSGAPPALDDRTWRDVDLDAVFVFLDRTESIVGRQLLYHRLRSTNESPAGLAAFDDLVELLRRDEPTRIAAQHALASLNRSSCYWLWSIALEPIEPFPRWAVIYPLFAVLMAVSLLLIPLVRGFALVPVLGLVVGGALRAKFGWRLVPLADSFRDMVTLLVAAERLGALEPLPPQVRQALTTHLPALARLRRSAGWLGRDQASSADVFGFLIEYINLLFCADANTAILSVRELRRHQEDVHQVFQAVGELDAALSVASVRDGGGAWTRPVFAQDGQPAVFDDLTHPLLDNAVPNSLTLGPPDGLLVTGANMTGKSTFLRTVGVNVVVAQTLNTAFASSYRAPWLSVASCITPADDLQAGKSYYQVEVETLVAMLAATRSAGTRLYLFDELFRGTNTLDRIGAATAVLSWLVRTNDSDGASVRRRCLVIAATHDLELVSLLTPGYAVVHFADRLTDVGLHFDYLLRPGPTTTRNAIALLGVLGAPPEVVGEALERTERLRAASGGSLGVKRVVD